MQPNNAYDKEKRVEDERDYDRLNEINENLIMKKKKKTLYKIYSMI